MHSRRLTDPAPADVASDATFPGTAPIREAPIRAVFDDVGGAPLIFLCWDDNPEKRDMDWEGKQRRVPQALDDEPRLPRQW